MKTITDLQTLLESRAKEKLRKDVLNFIDSVRDNKLFKPLANLISPALGNTRKLYDWFYYEDNNSAYGEIYKAFLSEYIESESKAFLSKVENIQNEIDELKDSIQ